MSRAFRVFPLLPLLALGGCTTIVANSDFLRETDFSTYRTYTQAPPHTERIEALPGYSPITAQRIQREIGSMLEKKGFEAQAEGADLLVAFTVGGERRTDIVTTGRGYYGSGRPYARHYVEGQLVIDIFDQRQRGKRVWHGWATKKIMQGPGDTDTVEKVVQAIMKAFPPKPAS